MAKQLQLPTPDLTSPPNQGTTHTYMKTNTTDKKPLRISISKLSPRRRWFPAPAWIRAIPTSQPKGPPDPTVEAPDLAVAGTLNLGNDGRSPSPW